MWEDASAVRAGYATLASPGGLTALQRDLLAPEVDLDFTALPDGAVFRGIDVFRAFRRESPCAGEPAVEPEEFIEAGEDELLVLVLVRVRSHPPAMGAGVEGRYAHLLTFHGQRVIRWKLFHDRGQARREAGLDPG